MDLPIPEAVYTYWPLAALLSGLSVLAAVLKIVRGAWDFHYDYVTRRHLKRMAELLPLAEAGSQQHKFLRQVINAELFKIASGLKATDHKAAAMMHLCEHGLVSSNQVKKFSPFVWPAANGQIAIKISRMDTVFMIYAAICAAAIFIYGLWAFARLAYLTATTNAVMPMVVGSVVFLGCSFVVRYFLNDVRRYLLARRVREKLKSDPLPPCDALRNSPY